MGTFPYFYDVPVLGSLTKGKFTCQYQITELEDDVDQVAESEPTSLNDKSQYQDCGMISYSATLLKSAALKHLSIWLGAQIIH